MKTRHIAVLATLLLATPVGADEKKEEKKPVVKAKVEIKTGALTKVEAKVPGKAEVKPATKAEVKATKAEPKKVEPKATAKTEAKVEVKPEPKIEVKAEPKAEPTKAAVPSSQPVVVPPVDPDDIGGILKQILVSAKTGKWALLVGFIIMLLTWLVNKLLKQKIPANVMPWLAIGLSTIATVAFSLATGVGWLNALIVGFQHGLMAAGGWSAVGKYIPGLVKKPAEEPKP